MGGRSREREISLRSGRAMLDALQSAGLDAIGLDLDEDWPQAIRAAGIDKAVVALHGTLGEDGCVQGLLEILRVPYTGSGVTASALCMHKRLCKSVLSQAGLKTPADIPIGEHGPIRYPVVLKPVAEGSSIGLRMLERAADWQRLDIRQPAVWMAEMPIRGPEIAVSVLNGHALPPVEVVPRSGTYDFEAKYTAGATEYYCPARIPPESLKLCMQCAEAAVRLTGCRGAPRVDMILADGGEPVILEINTIPGMTETSLLPKAAAEAGIGFTDLCLRILESAMLDHAGEAA
jgi:D-alanine-D-alanine ligase